MPAEEACSACGGELSKLGEDVSEMLEYIPASFKVNQVIPGWIEALQLMREGDHWQLVIPSSLGYGPRGAGKAIPPDQTLVFDMTLVSTTPAPRRGEPGYIPDPNDPEDKQDH